MGEEELDADPNTLKDSPMTLLKWFKKGGHGTSLFC
jgi:hypothetical protein